MGLFRKKALLCFLAGCLLRDLSLQAAENTIHLRGHVTEQDSGQPVAGIEVGVVRVDVPEAENAKKRIKPDRVAATDSKGLFEFSWAVKPLSGQDVYVFTCAKNRINVIHPDVKVGTPVPAARDFKHAKAVRLEPGHEIADLNLRLPPPPIIMRDVMVPMRDGTRLATDIYLPPRNAVPRPALLYRTPYNKASQAIPVRHLDAQYAVIWQDFRGRFASEGKLDVPFLPDAWGEQQDGYDTIEWVAAQPWCNGKVGTLGASAGGITQVMTAGSAPPHLVCQTIAVACGSMYHHAAYQGGVFRKADVVGWLKNNRFSPDCLKLFLKHPLYDDLWRAVDTSTCSSRINVPGLFIGGWYDVFCQGTIDAFMWRQDQGGPNARGKQKLLMGPWVHGRSRNIGEFTLPEHAVVPPPETSEKSWLDHWMKGVPNEIADSPAVVYYVMGAFGELDAPGHEWRHSNIWPVPSTATPFYLHSDGSLQRGQPSMAESFRAFSYDPREPVPTVGGCNLVLGKGPYDQQRIENRPDVLLYTSPPLKEPLEVTGRIRAVLFASSSCRDTDFTAKLTDVYPDGRSVLIQDGIIRACHRNSFERKELITPGKVYRFDIDLWSTSVVFNRGHRLRLAVSSSNAPRFEPNPNTGEPFWPSKQTVMANNRVYHDAEHPSHLLVPVIEARK